MSSARSLATVVTAALVVALGPSGSAQSARGVVEEAQRRTSATSYRYEGLLSVIDAKGKVADKRWTFDRLGSHGRSKAVLRFTAPAEVRGVALLIVNHPDRASDQWMWTPALERDRRIALQDRSTRFFGTDFSFEDLEERDLEQFDYSSLAEVSIDGTACWRVESTPKNTKSSQYTRSLLWFRKDNYALVRSEHYNAKGVSRRIDYSDLTNVQGIWTARTVEVTDVARGGRTRLSLDKLQYNLPLKDADFSVQALRRQ